MGIFDGSRIGRRDALGGLFAGAAVSCAPTPPPTPTAAPPSPTAASRATAPLRLNGKVASVATQKVTLDNGKSFTLATDTRIVRSLSATAKDLQVGDFVAITAKRQSDATLLASMINIFAPSMKGAGAGQRPMDGGNLMTNATIENVTADGFSAQFPGGTAQVKLAPDAKLMKLVDATPADVKEGETVAALVAGDIARSVSITGAGVG
jgi:hypothetical protein